MPQEYSVLTPGKSYRLRLWTKEEIRARVTGETGDRYLLTLLEPCGLGGAFEDASVAKHHVKLLEELP